MFFRTVFRMQIIFQLLVLTGAGILYAVALNMFLVPHHMLSGGFAGIGMIIGYLTEYDIGMLIFCLNIPVLILGYFHLGKKFTLLTAYSIAVSSLALHMVPVLSISSDILLSSVFGGVISGVAVGMIFRFSSSMGGFDIIGLTIAKYRDFPLGVILFIFNSILLSIAGFIFGWEITLYSLIAKFVYSKVIDTIHTKHMKLTLMIVTEKGAHLKKALLDNCIHGVTMVDAIGAYTNADKKVLYTVITRYELSDVKTMIRNVDKNAFVNITETVEVIGRFRRT